MEGRVRGRTGTRTRTCVPSAYGKNIYRGHTNMGIPSGYLCQACIPKHHLQTCYGALTSQENFWRGGFLHFNPYNPCVKTEDLMVNNKQ